MHPEPITDPHAISVWQAGFSNRVLNAMKAHGIKTLAEVEPLTEKELLKWRNLGKKSIAEIRSALEERSLKLGTKDAPRPNSVVEPVLRAEEQLLVATLDLGVRASSVLQATSAVTLGDLTQFRAVDLMSYKNFGNKSLSEVRAALARFGLALAGEKVEPQSTAMHGSTGIQLSRERFYFQTSGLAGLNSTARALELSRLPLQREGHLLKELGILSLGQLVDALELGIPQDCTSRPIMFVRLQSILGAIGNSVTDSGGVDWERYGQLTGNPVAPHPDVPLANGCDFLRSLELVTEQLARESLLPVESDILLTRIVPNHEACLTLAEVAARHGLTRERIRQRQERLVGRIADAILHDAYQSIRVRFCTKFTDYWRAAARGFSGAATVSATDFIDSLAAIWGVGSDEVLTRLPIVYAVLTREVEIPREIRLSCAFTVPRNLRRDDLRYSDLPISEIHPSRTLNRFLEQRSIRNFRALRRALSDDQLAKVLAQRDRLRDEIAGILKDLAAATSEDGEIDWQAYASAKGIKVLPLSECTTAEQFVEQVQGALRMFVEIEGVRVRALLVYDNRIVKDSRTRKTLQDTAMLGASHGPAIKRVESETLERLFRAIFASDYVGSGARFQRDFVGFWIQARGEWEQGGNINVFAERLSRRWHIGFERIRPVVPLLYAVLHGAPEGYPGRVSLRTADESAPGSSDNGSDPEPKHAPMLVRLRGFREVC